MATYKPLHLQHWTCTSGKLHILSGVYMNHCICIYKLLEKLVLKI
jgi:hypothetical protein